MIRAILTVTGGAIGGILLSEAIGPYWSLGILIPTLGFLSYRLYRTRNPKPPVYPGQR
jgi:hypothetical protein